MVEQPDMKTTIARIALPNFVLIMLFRLIDLLPYYLSALDKLELNPDKN